MKLLKQAEYFGYVITKPSTYLKLSMKISSDLYLQKIISKLKGRKLVSRPHFQLTFLVKMILHCNIKLLTKFHFQAVFTSKVIQ